MRLYKYHALGNDYLIWPADPTDAGQILHLIPRICDRHLGLGADGVLVGTTDGHAAKLRIFNPDGSEAQKSGNGIRIFARYLADYRLIPAETFEVAVGAERLRCEVRRDGHVLATLGRVEWIVPRGEAPGEPSQPRWLLVGGEHLQVATVCLGNPHCVVLVPQAHRDQAETLGPLIERHPWFPQRTNVQFVEVVDRNTLRLEIWERGAGYTLASGTSSGAAAAVTVRNGMTRSPVVIQSPGGAVTVDVDPDFVVTLSGPVTRIAEIEYFPDPACSPHPR